MKTLPFDGRAPVFVAITVLITSCTGPNLGYRPARLSQLSTPQAGFSPAELEQINLHCPFGLPKKNPEWDLGLTHYVIRDGYVLEHSAVDKVPIWVCELVTANQLTGNAKRRNAFNPDPALSPGQRAELSDYRGSGFDRGHQAPAGNQQRDQRLKDETFYLSNMAPQVGAFNQQIWAALEDLTRTWVSDDGGTHMITGGFFYDPAEEAPETADGVIEFGVIGENKVAVPTHFYKIIVNQRTNGRWDAIAFVMENRKYPKPYTFETHIQSIDWIEERTGLDFMPDLDPLEEQRLEKNKASMWQ